VKEREHCLFMKAVVSVASYRFVALEILKDLGNP